MLEKLSADDFKPLVDSDFGAQGPGNTSCNLKLTEVLTHSFESQDGDPENMREAFSLMFVAPEDFIGQQGHVDITHPAFNESISVFMVALEKLEDPPGHIRCQVAFN